MSSSCPTGCAAPAAPAGLLSGKIFEGVRENPYGLTQDCDPLLQHGHPVSDPVSDAGRLTGGSGMRS